MVKNWFKIFQNVGLLTLLFVFLWLTGCKSEKIDGYETYENDTYGLTISYPQEWYARPRAIKNEIGPIVMFNPPTKDSLIAHITVFTEKLPEDIKDLEGYFNYSKKMFLSQAHNLELLNTKEDNINGSDTYRVEFTYNRGHFIAKSLIYMFIIDGKGYVVSSVTNTESFEKFEPIFEKVSRSIKFN